MGPHKQAHFSFHPVALARAVAMMVVIAPLTASVMVMILSIGIHHHGGDTSKKDKGEG